MYYVNNKIKFFLNIECNHKWYMVLRKKKRLKKKMLKRKFHQRFVKNLESYQTNLLMK